MALTKLTLDFETYYDKEYSLSKLTTEEYIRDERFEVIGVSVKVDNGETVWASGTHEEIADFLSEYDWKSSILICQNTAFDGAILNWHFGIKPKIYADTMCMSRAWDGVHKSASLAKQSERRLGKAKGTEVIQAMGMRRLTFSEPELSRYGDYCINDVELTYELFMQYLKEGFPVNELKVIDLTLRMFIEPTLQLDLARLESHLYDVSRRKERLIEEAGVTKEDLMSANKFADLLRGVGIEPPTKISPKTGKQSYAFAKTDQAFKDLLEHHDDRVQALASARLGNKSTLEESRAQRFIGIAKRGILPVPIKYYGAHTGRWSGQDKINLQNLPSRGPNGKKLKNTIKAPEGHVCIEADLAQIEARIVAWLAGQRDLIKAFARGEDVYKLMASKIYGIAVEDVTAEQRFIGKMTILGCGYGMGADRFKDQIKAMGNVEIPLDESRMIVSTYRNTNHRIKQLWRDANEMLEYMARGEAVLFGKIGVLSVNAEANAIIMPNGLPMYYNGLHVTGQGQYCDEYGVKTRNGIEKIYGGKVIENVCQALAKLVIADQMLLIKKRYPVALTVHDSMVALAPKAEADNAAYYVFKCLRYVPDWAEGLPLDCDVGYHEYYGSCGDNTDEVTDYCKERWSEERMDIIGQNGNKWSEKYD